MSLNLNDDVFFRAVRPIFGGTLNQGQVDGMNAILAAWRKYGDSDPRKLAYCLGTARLETAGTMAPIDERGGDAYFNRRYGPTTKVGGILGNVQKGDGARYHGRGFVQITGRDNYRRMGGLLGVDLEGNPERAREPAIAGPVMVIGMMRGLFTGKALGAYFTAKVTDWANARRVVNGLDRADDIATFAKQFHAAVLAAVQAGGRGDVAALVPPPEPPPPPAAKRPETYVGTGTIGVGTVIAAKEIADQAGATVSTLRDATGKAVETVTVIREQTGGLAGWFPPWLILVLALALVAAGIAVLVLRQRQATVEGV